MKSKMSQDFYLYKIENRRRNEPMTQYAGDSMCWWPDVSVTQCVGDPMCRWTNAPVIQWSGRKCWKFVFLQNRWRNVSVTQCAGDPKCCPLIICGQSRSIGVVQGQSMSSSALTKKTWVYLNEGNFLISTRYIWKLCFCSFFNFKWRRVSPKTETLFTTTILENGL